MNNNVQKELQEVFASYPFKLDSFQKESIKAIRREESVLVTAHTGSGKTLVADYAIKHAKQKNKRVIYTSPIKSLSNQKFHEFSKKYEDIMSVGILTGDIKFNPDAECLIMTTEILRNLLYKKNSNNEIAEKHLAIDINIERDVDSVIFDEVHYINDMDRGKVWEECIVMLPKHIKLVMLSATIDRPEDFAKWIENIKEKRVVLASNDKRPIPLTFSMFYFTKFPKKHKKTMKLFNDEKYIKAVSKMSNKKMMKIMESDGRFDNATYNHISDLIKYERKNGKYYSDVEVLNAVVNFLQKKNKLPALFFIFSRKRCEEYAHKIQVSLNTASEQNQVEKIIDQQIRILANPDIYLENPKLYELKKLLVKGIAIHHSGLIPIYKEIIEILYSKGLIKILLATETFAVGVNMPTKTVIFTGFEKYTKQGKRLLYSHEFQQMAGRAGRRGLDSQGSVIILSNMFKFMPSCHQMGEIMNGRNQSIQSKFNFNYQFLLKVLLANDINIGEFITQTLLKKNVKEELVMTEKRIVELKQSLNSIKYTIPRNAFDQYYFSQSQKIAKKYPTFKEEYQIYLDTYEQVEELKYRESRLPVLQNSMNQDQLKSIKYLIEHKYVEDLPLSQLNDKSLSTRGLIASQINECNEILFTEALMEGIFDGLNPQELAAVISVFTDTKMNDEYTRNSIESLDFVPQSVKDRLHKLEAIANKYEDSERKHEIYLDNNWKLNLDMAEYTYMWCSGKTFGELDYVNFEGNFIRDMIRIDNIAKDLETMSEIVGKLDTMNSASQINEKIIRDIVTVESIYVRI